MSYTLQNPLAYFPLPTKSSAAGLCKLYVGLIDADPLTPANQVQVYAVQPDGSELAIPQPIQLSAGGVPQYNGSPVQLKVSAETVSVKVTTSGGALVYYTPRWESGKSGNEYTDSKFAALAAVGSQTLVGGMTAENVALAADISLGNFVTPEQFFTGDPNSPSADFTSAVNAAIGTGNRVLLSRIYRVSQQITVPSNRTISGMSRDSTGFFRSALGDVGAVVAIAGNNVTLTGFRVDANNVGSAPSNRVNAVSIGAFQGFYIAQVDVYNATGYGHVTFGSEANPNVTGVYEDCYAENCQVLFEQIGALNVSLNNCEGLATAGRTLSIFHPYAGSKTVTYVNCHGRGVAGAGIEAVTTAGKSLGPFTFINCSIDIAGTTSAIYTGVVSGDPTANVNMSFFGGTYKTSQGQSVTLQTRGKFRAFGSRFEGYGGFNCPAISSDLAATELSGCDIVAELNDATATVFAMITNGNNPKISGGSITAKNNLAGGAQAVLGGAIISRETRLIPAAASQQVNFVAESAGVVKMQTDSSTLGFAIINLPVNQNDPSKIVVSLSINNRGSADYLPQADNISWKLSGGGTSITVRYVGNNPDNLWLCYRIGIMP
jgi:hypothetical protein